MTDSTEPRSAEDMRSVMYRTGPITPADYQEAANEMAAAVRQADVAVYGCAICSDSGHTAEGCHHNILIAARKWAAATRIYVCYHCGFVATNDEEAKDHFGANDEDAAKCARPSAGVGEVEKPKLRVMEICETCGSPVYEDQDACSQCG